MKVHFWDKLTSTQGQPDSLQSVCWAVVMVINNVTSRHKSWQSNLTLPFT